ncbi:hypothetical protein RCL1_001166 [Eukaryota sp. TZLM3-RCL]
MSNMPSKSSKKKRSVIKRGPKKPTDFIFTKEGLPEYQPLQDVHASHYFSNPQIQRQLLKMGLIDPYGRMCPQSRVEAVLRCIDRELEKVERSKQLKELDEQYQRRKQQQQLQREKERELVFQRTQAARSRLHTRANLL